LHTFAKSGEKLQTPIVPGRVGSFAAATGVAVGDGEGLGVAVATAAGFVVDALADACTEPTVLAPTTNAAARKRLRNERVFTTRGLLMFRSIGTSREAIEPTNMMHENWGFLPRDR
jgi:hypothetical protein